MPARTTRLLIALGVLVAGLLLAVTTSGMGVGLLHLAPALLLVVPLLAGRYVGEERLAAMAAAFAPRRTRGNAPLSPRGPRPVRSVVRGGLLVASGLAERGPPRGPLPAR